MGDRHRFFFTDSGHLLGKRARKNRICDKCGRKRFLIDLMRFLSYANDLYHFGTALCPKKTAPTFVCGETAEKRQYTKQVDSQSSFGAEMRHITVFNRSCAFLDRFRQMIA